MEHLESAAGLEKETQKLFTRIAGIYDSFLFGIYFGPLYEKTIELIRSNTSVLGPRSKVLDLACGTGEVISRLAREFPHVEFTGVDITLAMLEVARKKTKNLSNVDFIVADAEQLPFQENKFDVVIFSEAFHHVGNAPVVLSEIRRVLNYGGIFILADPGSDTWIQRLIFKHIGGCLEPQKKVYTQKEVKSMLEQHLFKIENFFRFWMNNFFVSRKSEPWQKSIRTT